jgi:hypothetical protein
MLAVAAVAFTEDNLNWAIIVSIAVWTVTCSVLAASVCPWPVIPVRLGRTTAARIPRIATTMSSSTRGKPFAISFYFPEKPVHGLPPEFC